MKDKREKLKVIYAFIGDPFHKFWIEDAAKDIRYEKRWNSGYQCTMYKIGNPRRDGWKFMDNLKRILHENDEQIHFNRKSAMEGKVILWDDDFDASYKASTA